ncbi:MAG: phosphatidate cytidylyltransferase [Planctomycetales bacterium]|nr:phosphatidate cytidylyltransferase [Planctomycetales bacterium]NIM08402.1 phosphatidate cytidylyltransferase [Planctomycetales bacterium]NIN07877.1 phosphatidate cytidylyltransferase [Planctomycetales bacterium]NIN77007.1 phosphatidate cytidylyltransferase [Planctomycetales bacterium]NIO34190.1 phosphatidate cytidylyltransferase [Planctomycetales bacterium]
MLNDPYTWYFVGGVLLLLGGATAVGQFLKGQPESSLNPAMIDTFNRRVRAWWLLCSLLAASLVLHREVSVVLFGLLAFWALREFITLTPTRLSDHRTLFWVFLIFTPLQYVLVGLDKYDIYSIFIPLYGLLFVTARVAFSGDPKRFLERTAKIQAGLVFCVYCLSFAPALLYLQIYQVDTLATLAEPAAQGDPGGSPVRIAMAQPWPKNALLLFYFVFLVQMGDALQYVWGKVLGQRVIAPAISPTRTWEGFLGGVGSTALLGAVLSFATPFNHWQAAAIALVVALAGFAGGMTMSAIKRDRGVKDYGTLVVGHGGVLDRIDSLCFAAPIFFHITKVFFTAG